MHERLTSFQWLQLASVVAAMSCAAGCQKTRSDVIVLGHAECLSGQHAKAGQQAVAGIRACLEWLNREHGGLKIGGERRAIEYVVYDCESSRESVGPLLERLITVDAVSAAIAPYSSGLTLAGAPVAEKYNVVYLDHGGAGDEIFEQGFELIVQTIGPGTRYHVGTLNMLHAANPQAKRLALVYEDSEFARAVQQGAIAHAKQLGYEIVFNQTYPPAIRDLNPLLSSLKAAQPDIVLGGGHFEDGQLITRQMADLGIQVQALSLIASATLPAFGEALRHNANGVMGPSHWEMGVSYSPQTAEATGQVWFGPTQEEFIALFKRYSGQGVEPDYHAAEAGAAVLSWALAAEMCGSLETTNVRKQLSQLRFASFYGQWAIDQTGLQVGHDMIDMQWQNDRRVIIWPKAAATGELIFPKPEFGRPGAAQAVQPKPFTNATKPGSFAAQLAGNVIQGLVLGAIYGAATMGLSLIFGVLRVVNVGHGAMLMLGAFTAWFLFERWQLVPPIAIPFALALGAALGLFFYFTALKRILKGPELATLLATYALGIVLEEVVKHIFTSESRGYTWDLGGIDLGVTVLPWRGVLAAVISVLLALAIYFWFQRTRLGTATRAVVQDDVAAAVCGINVPRVYALTFALGASLTALGGVLVTMYNPSGISPGMGHPYTLKAFIIAVLGGLTSPYGAFFAGLIFGVVENGSYLLLAQIPGIEPISAARFLSFVLLLVILLVRPTGLLGAK